MITGHYTLFFERTVSLQVEDRAYPLSGCAGLQRAITFRMEKELIRGTLRKKYLSEIIVQHTWDRFQPV